MKTVTIKEIIDIETILLLIDEQYKFKLTFGQLIILNEQLENIGKVTNTYFNILNEYEEFISNYQQNISSDTKMKLIKEYNDKILNDTFEINLNDIILFMKEVTTQYGNKDLQEKIKKLW